MPTQLRPNGVRDTLEADSPTMDTILAYTVQTVPDSLQAATIIEYWVAFTQASEDDPLILTFQCFNGYFDGAGVPIPVDQIGGDLVMSLADLAVDAPDTLANAKLTWIDWTPYQAGLYIIVGSIDDASPDTFAGQSIQLTAIGP